MPSRPRTVYLHVGPPKTGTTYLQEVLWRNQRRLGEHQVTFPDRPIEHFHAALDLRGLAFGGYDDPQAKGAWHRLSQQALSAPTEKVVISHELLAAATAQQIELAVNSLQPAEVHVVYGARDLARQLPAVWQESLKNRRKRTYPGFLTLVLRRRPRGPARAAFWGAQDAASVLRRWSELVPPDRIHVLTLPPRGAPPDLLWKRFCGVLAIEPAGFDLEVARTNTSLTPSEAEVLRRLNLVLPADLEWPAYERLVKKRFDDIADQKDHREPLRVPPRYRQRVLRRSQETQSVLAAAGYDVVGDLEDLAPGEESFGPARGMRPVPVADAAVDLLATALLEPPRGSGRLGDRWLGHVRRRGV